MIWRIFCVVLISAATLIRAQQEPIYVPFAWNQVPTSATQLLVSGSTTTFVLLEGEGRRATLGPATLIQKPSEATMTYVGPSATLSGICNLRSPIAVCTLNVYETGAVFPSTGLQGRPTTTSRGGGGETPRPGAALSGTATSSMGGFVLALATVVLGFAVAVTLIR